MPEGVRVFLQLGRFAGTTGRTSRSMLSHALGPATPVGRPVKSAGPRYHIKKHSSDVPDTMDLFHHIYSASALSLLPSINAYCRRRNDPILNKEADGLRGLSPKEKQHIRRQIADYAPLPITGKAAHLRSLVEGYYITDPNHHCLKFHQEKLQGLNVRVNGERGLRAKQDLPPYQLLGAYCGEVVVQQEYDANLEYDFALGDNVRDDKTFNLWPPEDQGDDPSKELVIVGRLASNPLALVNDPTGSGHAPNAFAVHAWNAKTEEVSLYYFAKKDGVRKGQELWLDYGPGFRRHLLHDEPARLAVILKLRSDIKSLEDRDASSRAKLHDLTLAREGDSAQIQGLQATVETCQYTISELQAAQTKEAIKCQATKAQLLEERENWRGERKGWMTENGELREEIEKLKASLHEEEKRRMRERMVAAYTCSEVECAAAATVDQMQMELDALRAAHAAPHRLLADATAALHSQVHAQQADLMRARRQLAEAERKLAAAERDCTAERSARADLGRAKQQAEAQLQYQEAEAERLQASSKEEAVARTVAERARAEAAAFAGQLGQLKAQLAAKSEELRKSHRRRSVDAKAHVSSAAEIGRLRESCAREAAARKRAEAAAHRAATEMAALMQGMASEEYPADQQPSRSESKAADLSAGGMSMSAADEDQALSGGHPEHGKARDDESQLQEPVGMALEEHAHLGSPEDKGRASPQAVAVQGASTQVACDQGGSQLQPAWMDVQHQTQGESSKPMRIDSGTPQARYPLNQDDCVLALSPARGQPLETLLGSDQPSSKRRRHSKHRHGSKGGRHSERSARQGKHGSCRHSRSRSPASSSSPGRSGRYYRGDWPQEMSAQELQRSYSPFSRHRHSPASSFNPRRSSRYYRGSWPREMSARKPPRSHSPSSLHRHTAGRNPEGRRRYSPAREYSRGEQHHGAFARQDTQRHSPVAERRGSRAWGSDRDPRRRLSNAGRSGRQEQEGRCILKPSQSSASDYGYDHSWAHSGQGWADGQPAGLGQQEDSMPGDKAGWDLLSADTHATQLVKQEPAEQATGWSSMRPKMHQGGSSSPLRDKYGMRIWKKPKRTRGQRKAESAEGWQALTRKIEIFQKSQDALNSACTQAGAVQEEDAA